MPLYEYHCQACGNTFEKLLPIEGRDLASCEKCGAKADRLVSPFQFKLFNKFIKDGPGFESIYISKDEYKDRIGEKSLEEALANKNKNRTIFPVGG